MYKLCYTHSDTGEVMDIVVSEHGLQERLASVKVLMPAYRKLAPQELRAEILRRSEPSAAAAARMADRTR